MVAAMGGVDEDDERRLDERPMHQGCMAGFLHLFDRPQILSGRRLHASHRRLTSASSGTATPSERSMPLERATPAPSSPDMTPPAAPRPSLQLPPLDLNKDASGGGVAGFGAAPSWRLPRLSLDSRAVVDARGKLRPREIRTSAAAGAPPSPPAGAGDERRSPSVVARLMGLDALPHGEAAAAECGGQQYGHGGAATSPAALRRSASERVPRDHPPQFRFVDPSFFERPASPLPPPHRPSPALSPATEESAMRRAPDPAAPRAFQRRSRFDAHDVFPEPAKRAAADLASSVSAAAAASHGGEIALYGEIERRLRKRGIAEPARDLETLKQILEALQLKGLLHHHHTAAPPPPPQSHAQGQQRTPPPPPIVVMRPSTRAQMPPPQMSPPARRLRVDVVDRAPRRPRSPDLASAPSPARSPASPSRRGSLSPQRRLSPAQSPKQQQQSAFRKASGFDATAARARIARRAAHNAAAALSPDDEASTTFSDGGSSSSLSASSRWDFDPQPDPRADRGLLERCGKLLSSIQAFTGGDAAGADQQPSPVSVLDAAAFLADEDSPSSSKRAIDFRTSSVALGRTPKPAAAAVSDPEDDEWAPLAWPVVDPDASGGGDPEDYAYVAELVRLLGGARGPRDPADAYRAAEQRRRQRGGCDGGDTWLQQQQQHRRLLSGAVAEALERQRAACPWEPAAWLRGADLVAHVWAEVRRAGEPAAAEEPAADLNDVTCSAIRRDLAADGGSAWGCLQQQRRRHGAEVADAVLQIERLLFKDLVADTIRELADADRPPLPRRKLVF